MAQRVHIGTAGWSIPKASHAHFPAEGTHLHRYGLVMPAVEINSSFYRPHAAAVYKRWADSVPADFRFSVKVPKAITHELRLRQPAKLAPLLRRFLDETGGLGHKLGPLLVQLPPSLAFDSRIVNRFFQLVRSMFEGSVVCEPRHGTWFSGKASQLLMKHQIARVAADPVRAPTGDTPGGWPQLVYFRLHGSPRVYWSSYDEDYLQALRQTLNQLPPATEAWVIFDNTASGAALANAIALRTLMRRTTAG